MTWRILPHDEWARLDGTGIEALWPTLDPTHSVIIVVERDGEIVASWVFLTVPHVEGLWIREDDRGRAAVARKLLGAMRETVASHGAAIVMTGAIDESVRALLGHAGAMKAPDQYFLPLVVN